MFSLGRIRYKLGKNVNNLPSPQRVWTSSNNDTIILTVFYIFTWDTGIGKHFVNASVLDFGSQFWLHIERDQPTQLALPVHI
jgi:hypothetical protein